MDKKIFDKVESELNPVISEILINNIDSEFISRKILEKALNNFAKVFDKFYNLRLKESKNLGIEFDKNSAINVSMLPTINSTINYIKESLLKENISEIQIDKIVRDLNIKLKSKLKFRLVKILAGKEVKDKIFREVLTETLNSRNYILDNLESSRQDLIQRINSIKDYSLKEFFSTQEGKNFLSNISRLNDIELTDKLFSNGSRLLESIVNISFSIDCKDKNPLEVISKSLGLLKMITFNPKVINSIEKKPNLLKLFKDKNYDSSVSNNAKDLANIFVAIPNRISKSKPGQINISNDDYSKLNNKTRSYIDDYRTIMSDYYPENLVDVFESKVYSAISEGLDELKLDNNKLRIKLIEHFANYYLDIFNKRRNQNIYENKMNSELGKYFISNSSVLNAHKYALKELNKYILSEGLMDRLKKSLFGGKISSGTVGKLNNWFKNITVMKYMKRVSNAMDENIESWEKKLNPSQKKMFNEYPHLKAIFATGGLDTNLATHLVQNKSMLKLLNNYPNLAVIIAKNPKVADLLLKRDKRLLPKIMENPEIFDWLEDNAQLTGKILEGNSNNLQVLQACILNFNLATKIASDDKIISEIGLENLVDLAELMNSSSDLAELLDQLDPKEFKELAKVLFEEPEVLDFLQSNKGKELVKIAKSDTSDTVVRAIIDNPDNFREDLDFTKIEGNDSYNKILNKYKSKFKNLKNERGNQSLESIYIDIWKDSDSDKKKACLEFKSKYKVEPCALINIDTLKQDSSVLPEISDESDEEEYFWIYKEDGKFKVVINARKIKEVNYNSPDKGYKYLFDLVGSKSKGVPVEFIEPAIFKENDNKYSLVKKGKLKLARI